MTVTTTATKFVGNGNGVATVFSFDPIQIFDPDDLVVTKTDTAGLDTLLVRGSSSTEYSVTAAPASLPYTGSVTYPALGGTPLAAGEKITGKRVLTIQQNTKFRNQGGFFPDVAEAALDRLVMIDLQQGEDLDRAMKIPVSDTFVDMTLPGVTERANKPLFFGSSGEPIVVASAIPETAIVTAFAETLLDDATAAAARTTLDAASNTTNETITGDKTLSGTSIFSGSATFTGAVDVDGEAGIGTLTLTTNLAIAGEIDRLEFEAQNTAAADTIFSRIKSVVTAATAGAEAAYVEISNMVAGTLTAALRIGAGIFTPNATGGDQGADTINVSEIYDDGVQVHALSDGLGTEVATTSGTTHDFTGIRADAKRITIMFDSVSLSGTDEIIVLLGDSGGFETTGYTGDVVKSGTGTVAFSTSFQIVQAGVAALSYTGSVTLNLMDPATNKWIENGFMHESTATTMHDSNGRKSLSGVPTQLRVATNGANTFDGGSVNILVE